jgi:hypothetical protein
MDERPMPEDLADSAWVNSVSGQTHDGVDTMRFECPLSGSEFPVPKNPS